MALLEVSGLVLRYGTVEVVHDISFMVEENTIVALIGANGAGKTSVLRAISGLMRAVTGKIKLENKEISGMAANRIAKLGLAHVPEGRQLFTDLTVAENLSTGGYLIPRSHLRKHRQEAVLKRFPRLAERLHQRAGTLSGGEQQMLAIGRALMSGPKLFLLDEPSMGLAPIMVRQILAAVADLRHNGTTVLMVEQNARAALNIADFAYVMENGRITIQGQGRTLACMPEVVQAYLGTSGSL